MSDRPILIVDDDPLWRDIIAELLLMEGYPVNTAADGWEALHAIEQQRPSLVVTDVHMPNMDGAELVATLRELGYDPPILVVTATVRDTDEVARVMEAECLAKPIEVNTFLQAIKSLRCP